ncbi:unnamed protein product [Effrenium voratum]|nr:unnamed protein product [Effrenium voratum]
MALWVVLWVLAFGADQEVGEEREVEAELSAPEGVDPVQAELTNFCPHLHELPELFADFWRRLHGTALVLQQKLQGASETAALCSQLDLLRQVADGHAGLPFPQVANSCPTLTAIYFEWASELALAAGQPKRARALLQLGAPMQLMAMSRAVFRPDETKQRKDAQRVLLQRYSQKLRDLADTSPRKPWRAASEAVAEVGKVAVRSLCDGNFQGGNLENASFQVTLRNHLAYAEKWGYEYQMLNETPLADQEPQFGKLQIAIDVLSAEDAPEWLLWLDCDSLVANRSISLAQLLQTYGLHEAHFVVAEEVSGINSGVFLVHRQGLRFLRQALGSDWRFVWDQTMLLHQMSLDSDLFAAAACPHWRQGLEPRDFRWAPQLRLVPQAALNLFGEGSAQQWGAEAWQPGDFILHLAGCPLVEPPCREAFEEVARWAEENN